MLRDGRPRDVEPGRDLAGGQLAVADEREDLAATRVGEGLESRIEHPAMLAATYVSVNLRSSDAARSPFPFD